MEERVAVITGGSKGIGASTARRFAAEGYKLAILYGSDDESAKALLDELNGSDHLIFRVDVGIYEAVRDAINSIADKYGRIDVLVNSAGIAIENFIEMDEDDFIKSWDQTINTNLKGIANCSYTAFQIMKSQNSGAIVNVSSRGAFRGEPEMLAYGASKGGVNSLSQSMARALGKYGISVTAVAPGFVETRMARSILHGKKGEALRKESPFGRIAKPEEVADTIYFLAQPSSIFLSGTIVDVNGASFLRM